MKKVLLLAVPAALTIASCSEEPTFDAFVMNGGLTDSTCVPEFCWDFVYPLDAVYGNDTLVLEDVDALNELFAMCCESDSMTLPIDTLHQGTGVCSGDSTGHPHHGDRDRGGKHRRGVLGFLRGDKHKDGDSTCTGEKPHMPPCVRVLTPFEIYNLNGVADTVTVDSPREIKRLLRDCDV